MATACCLAREPPRDGALRPDLYEWNLRTQRSAASRTAPPCEARTRPPMDAPRSASDASTASATSCGVGLACRHRIPAAPGFAGARVLPAPIRAGRAHGDRHGPRQRSSVASGSPSRSATAVRPRYAPSAPQMGEPLRRLLHGRRGFRRCGVGARRRAAPGNPSSWPAVQCIRWPRPPAARSPPKRRSPTRTSSSSACRPADATCTGSTQRMRGRPRRQCSPRHSPRHRCRRRLPRILCPPVTVGPASGYGLGPHEYRYLPGASVSPDGRYFSLWFGSSDPVGRLAWSIQGSIGDPGTWRGGAAAATWNGLPVTIDLSAFAVSQFPSRQSAGRFAPDSLDITYQGALLAASYVAHGSPLTSEARLGLSAAPMTLDDGPGHARSLVFVAYTGAANLSRGDVLLVGSASGDGHDRNYRRHVMAAPPRPRGARGRCRRRLAPPLPCDVRLGEP